MFPAPEARPSLTGTRMRQLASHLGLVRAGGSSLNAAEAGWSNRLSLEFGRRGRMTQWS